MDFSFETLNDIDFENLVCDLLNEKLKSQKENFQFRTFAAGRDKGIDLLDSESIGGTYNCIVQVKHYLKTSYPTMASNLFKGSRERKSELEKIHKLSPKRYILVTSKDLTISNQEEIFKKMQPYILSLNDIIDRSEINRMLAEFPRVVEKHFKLWFSGSVVLKRILNSHLHQASEDFSSHVLEKIRLYVETKSINAGLEILKETSCLVITGEPGCGKTSYAEMVLTALIGEGFEVYNIVDSVLDFEKVITNDDLKQVFFFDDFLGHTRYEMEYAKAKEKSLLSFVKRIRLKRNKYFILTTRSSLINSAAMDSERFERSVLFQKKYEISIDLLSHSSKRRIIENHVVVNGLPTEYSNVFSIDFIEEIANHKNFSPRLIEFVTSRRTISIVASKFYHQYILEQLANPSQIWQHAFEQQINEVDRFFLTTLYSFGEEVDEKALALSFEERLQTELQTNGFIRQTSEFNNCLKRLLGSFLRIKHYHNRETITFINPSFEDFLNGYLINRESEKVRIINAAYFVEQVLMCFRATENYLTVSPKEFFRIRLEENKFETVITQDERWKRADAKLQTAFISHMFFKDSRGVQCTSQILKTIDWQWVFFTNEFYFLNFLYSVTEYSEIVDVLSQDFEWIVMVYARNCGYLPNLAKLIELFPLFGKDYGKFISCEHNSNYIGECVIDTFDEDISELIESLTNHATDLEAVYQEIEEMEEQIQDWYCQLQIDNEVILKQLREIDWEFICTNNAFKEAMSDEDGQRGPIRAFDEDNY